MTGFDHYADCGWCVNYGGRLSRVNRRWPSTYSKHGLRPTVPRVSRVMAGPPVMRPLRRWRREWAASSAFSILHSVMSTPTSLSMCPTASARQPRLLAVNLGGGATVKSVVLISPEDMDKASNKTVDYKPPGKS